MSRKEYVKVAAIFAKYKHHSVVDSLVLEFVHLFEADNASFDRDRFIRACKAEPHGV